MAWQSEIKLNIAHAEIQRLNRPQVLLAGPRDDTSRLYWFEEMNEADDMLFYAVVIGLFVPIGLLILSPFGWFIYRGFKPKLPPQSP